jgi:hypothetical protein
VIPTNSSLTGHCLFSRVLDGQGRARSIGWEDPQRWNPAVPRGALWGAPEGLDLVVVVIPAGQLQVAGAIEI